MIVRTALPDEIDFASNGDGWAMFAEELRRASREGEREIELEQASSPEPYEAIAHRIVIRRTKDARGCIRIVTPTNVEISGPSEVLAVLGQNAEFTGRELQSGCGAHIHIDSLSFPDHLSDDTANAVFSLT